MRTMCKNRWCWSKAFFWRAAVWLGLTAGLTLLPGCQVSPTLHPQRSADAPAMDASPGAMHTIDSLFPGWTEKPLPGKRWQPFVPVVVNGEPGLQVRSNASLSLLRTHFKPHRALPAELQFSWWVDNLLPEADLSDSQASDAPAQIALAFDGDRSLLSGRFAVMSELTQLVTGTPLPYATLIYVWATGPQHPVGTVLKDPRTDRIRYLVVDQGEAHLRRWVRHRRAVQADFALAFGEPAGPLMGMAIMSDSDNTGGSARAVFGRVTLLP